MPQLPSKQKAADLSTNSSMNSQQNTLQGATLFHSDLKKPPTILVAGKTSLINNFKQCGAKSVQDEWHQCIVLYTTTTNNSVRLVIDHTNCPKFKSMMEYIIEKASTLRALPPKLCWMGKGRFNNCHLSMYQFFLGVTAMLVTESRDAYTELAGKQIAFITVAHDILDSKKKELLGVTIFFYNPVQKQFFSIACGLIKVKDKTAHQVCSNTCVILNCVSVEKEDAYQAGKDTMTASVAASRLITVKGEQGIYIMHKSNLVIDHACGIKTQSKNNIVWNEFPECKQV
eukprot:12217054-Ditylum_brightwellii.AAC.1